jgi:hypothetical protein
VSPRFSEAMSVDVDDGSKDVKLRLRTDNSCKDRQTLSPTFNTPAGDSSPNVAMIEDGSPMMA